MTDQKRQELYRIAKLAELALSFLSDEGVQLCPSCGTDLQTTMLVEWTSGIVCPHCKQVYSWDWWEQQKTEWEWHKRNTVLTGYYGSDPCPQIPAHCRRIGSYAFSNVVVSKISIPSGVAVIEKFAFCNSPQLKQVSLPTGLSRIEEGAFMGCDKLEQIDLPPTVTYIGKNAFSGCAALKRIAIPLSVRMIDTHAFSGSGLRNLSIRDVFVIGDHAFSNCEQLRSVTLTGVHTIGKGAFSGCVRLQSPELTEGLLCIGEEAFSGCHLLRDVTVPSSVCEIGNHAFAHISSLEVHLPQTLQEYVECFSYFCVEVDERKCYLAEPTARIVFHPEVKL